MSYIMLPVVLCISNIMRLITWLTPTEDNNTQKYSIRENTKDVRIWFGQGLLAVSTSRKLLRPRELSSANVVLVQHSTTRWPWSCMPVKKCCVVKKSCGGSIWTRVAKWKAILMGKYVPSGSFVKKALNGQTFLVGYARSVDRKHLHTALCSNGYGTSTVARELHRQLSTSVNAAPWRLAPRSHTEDQWVTAAMYNLGESVEPEDNKTAANDLNANRFRTLLV